MRRGRRSSTYRRLDHRPHPDRHRDQQRRPHRLKRLLLPCRHKRTLINRRRPAFPPNQSFRPRPGPNGMAGRMSPQRFDELVSDALDLIPPKLAAAIDNVVIRVEGRHDEDPQLLGLYEGIALTERDSTYAGALPDMITIYRDALLDVCDTDADVVEEVAVTVIHEIAHHFGIDDQRLHELGWA
jgi:predicted Zn-dependent protease with MMP-like domain